MKTPKGILNPYFLSAVFLTTTFVSLSVIYSVLRQDFAHCVLKQLNSPCTENQVRIYTDMSNFVTISNFISVLFLLVAIGILVGIELRNNFPEEETKP